MILLEICENLPMRKTKTDEENPGWQLRGTIILTQPQFPLLLCPKESSAAKFSKTHYLSWVPCKNLQFDFLCEEVILVSSVTKLCKPIEKTRDRCPTNDSNKTHTQRWNAPQMIAIRHTHKDGTVFLEQEGFPDRCPYRCSNRCPKSKKWACQGSWKSWPIIVSDPCLYALNIGKGKKPVWLDPMEMILLEMMRKPTGEENPGIPCLIL